MFDTLVKTFLVAAGISECGANGYGATDNNNISTVVAVIDVSVAFECTLLILSYTFLSWHRLYILLRFVVLFLRCCYGY